MRRVAEMAEVVAKKDGSPHLSPGPVLGTESSLKVCARRDVEFENRVLISPDSTHAKITHVGQFQLTPLASFC